MPADPKPDPVLRFVAVLWREPEVLKLAIDRMQQLWGQILLHGPDRPFDLTNYYEAEMGSPISRRMIGFCDLASPIDLPADKRRAIVIEDEFRHFGSRRVNLDVGYLDHNKIVLASVKSAGQKIYLGQGVYADLVARYAHGRYQPFEWTFPDFKDGRYDAELKELRRHYLQVLRLTRDTDSV
jgi:hypothetical protein